MRLAGSAAGPANGRAGDPDRPGFRYAWQVQLAVLLELMAAAGNSARFSA